MPKRLEIDAGGLPALEMRQDTGVILVDEYPLIHPEPREAVMARRGLHASGRRRVPWWRRLWHRLLR